MRTPRPIWALLGALAAACAVGVGHGSAADALCGSSDYAYAGLQSFGSVNGVSATITSLLNPQVARGHVAGWVGVSSRNGQAWIQTGVSAFPGDATSHAYIEIAAPNGALRYVTVGDALPNGQRHRFGVLEIAQRPGWWRAWLDGKPVSRPVFLPGSHGRWHAQATGESWNDNSGACNLYAYSFESVDLATAPGGSWRRLRGGRVFEDPGYRLARDTHAGFVASSVVLPARIVATSAP